MEAEPRPSRPDSIPGFMAILTSHSAREKIRLANRTQDRETARKLEDTWWVGEWRGNGVFKGWWVGWIRNTATDNSVHLKLVSQYATVQYRDGLKFQNAVVSEDEYTAFSNIYTLMDNNEDCIDFLDHLIRTKRINPRNMDAAQETLKDIKGEYPSSDSEGSSSNLDEIGCEMCKGFDCSEDNDIVLCGGKDTGCGKGWHIRCLKIKELPEGDWFCPKCIAAGAAGSSKDDGKNLSKKKLEIAKILSNCQEMFEGGDEHAKSNQGHSAFVKPGSVNRNRPAGNRNEQNSGKRGKSDDSTAGQSSSSRPSQPQGSQAASDRKNQLSNSSMLKNDQVVQALVKMHNVSQSSVKLPKRIPSSLNHMFNVSAVDKGLRKLLVRIVDHEAAVSRRYLVSRCPPPHVVRRQDVTTDPRNSFVLFGVPNDLMEKAERERQRKIPKEKRKFFSDRNDFRRCLEVILKEKHDAEVQQGSSRRANPVSFKLRSSHDQRDPRVFDGEAEELPSNWKDQGLAGRRVAVWVEEEKRWKEGQLREIAEDRAVVSFQHGSSSCEVKVEDYGPTNSWVILRDQVAPLRSRSKRASPGESEQRKARRWDKEGGHEGGAREGAKEEGTKESWKARKGSGASKGERDVWRDVLDIDKDQVTQQLLRAALFHKLGIVIGEENFRNILQIKQNELVEKDCFNWTFRQGIIKSDE
ncbi:hypothetical protein GUITHDRAFT_163873 [Guillardia theta CCMP2712]|uniref:PHD-type domain-containing protein n=2 Tax=Guillardia theta TaxID=55529 RepID=L1J3X8_GUITC|nr:hypothetical protein GUITHDRAFT_163873 [Guillardia theta CCMP2712]EKX43233.1 hypothetical protein GUITHDRAFT_163873 [Guillardia theta CCMP2712]|eukprot:XP_005830213.1 hypothetical protein GUITHDRAFT_163873 [Guillardia theta CCMP2712]